MTQARGGRLGYRPDLDGVRAFAVLAVMAFHILQNLAPPIVYRGGIMGVDVFFVLSGYLITTLLIREQDDAGRVSRVNFYIRRALRLLPALFLTFIVGAITVHVTHAHFPRPYGQSVLLALAYIANWAQIHKEMVPLGHTWSLSIEEQYYIVWPTLLIIATRLKASRRMLAGLLLVGAAAMGIGRYYAAIHGHGSFALLSTITRPDSVLIGSALALLLADPPAQLVRFLARREPAYAAIVIVAIGTLTLGATSPNFVRGGLTLINLCTAIVVGHLTVAEDSPLRSLFSTKPLPFIGRISYGLYLFHIPILWLIVGYPAKNRGLVPVAEVYVLTFAVAIASFMLIERPALKLKSRFGSMSKTPDEQPAVG